MSWRADLITRLRGDAALAAAFGNRIAFFEAARTWSTYPQLVLQEVTLLRAYTHSGPDGLDASTVQFDIYADTDGSLLAGETALETEMESEAAAGGTRFHVGFLRRRRMLPSGDLANQRRVLRLSMDFTFFHETI